MRTRFATLFCFAFWLFLAQLAWAADSLTFFNNWFVTGDYVVAGVGLRGGGAGHGGWATGNINVAGVPNNAQPIAAFLYWSTVEKTTTPSAAVGYFNGNQIQGLVLGNPASPNPPCWASGSAPAGSAGFVYRADVLRFLPINSNNVFQANGTQTVKLPDSTGGTVLYTNGASLVVIYRIVVPGNPVVAPLRAVVIYDGAFTITRNTAPMTLTVSSLFQTWQSLWLELPVSWQMDKTVILHLGQLTAPLSAPPPSSAHRATAGTIQVTTSICRLMLLLFQAWKRSRTPKHA